MAGFEVRKTQRRAERGDRLQVVRIPSPPRFRESRSASGTRGPWIRIRERSERSEQSDGGSNPIPTASATNGREERRGDGGDSKETGRAQRSEHVRAWFESHPHRVCDERT